jgi:hypothetical protein
MLFSEMRGSLTKKGTLDNYTISNEIERLIRSPLKNCAIKKGILIGAQASRLQ